MNPVKLFFRRARRYVVALVLPLFVASIFIHQKQAYATVIPFPTSAAATVVEGAAEVVVGSAAAPITAIALGALLAYMYFSDGTNKAKVQLGTSPVAAPSAASTTAPIQGSFYQLGTFQGTDPGPVCTSWGGTFYNGNFNSLGYTNATGCSYYSNGNLQFTPASNYYYTGSYCPAGYSLSGSNCNLSNPYIASNYHGVDYNRSGATWTNPTPNSSTAAGLHPWLSTNTSTNDTLNIAGTNQDGNKQLTTIQALPSGGTSVTQYSPVITTSGDTYMQVGNLQLDSVGNVLSSGQQATQQQFAVDPATGQVSVTGSAQAATTPQNIQIPNDYARTGEAATAASGIVQELQSDKFNYGDVTPQLGGIPPSESIPSVTVTPSFQSLTFANSAICPADITYQIFGKDYALSYQPLCNFAGTIRPIILMIAAATVAIIYLKAFQS